MATPPWSWSHVEERHHRPESWIHLCCIILVLVSMIADLPANAQTCPPPWPEVPVLYGTFSIEGTANSTSGGLTQLTAQTISGQFKAPQVVPGFCIWSAPGPPGKAIQVSLKDQEQRGDCTPPHIFTTNFAAQGPDISGMIPHIDILPDGKTYEIDLTGGSVEGTVSTIDCRGTANGPDPWPPDWGPTLPTCCYTYPLPSSGTILSGTLQFVAPSADFPDSLFSATWKVTRNFSGTPDDTLDKQCLKNKASDIGCQNQSLGEDLPINGTPFSLHYQSDRQFGRAGADAVAISDAQGLGGGR
jgi:hypothetical protein